MKYAGIGSRRTPANTKRLMVRLGRELALDGYTLRSGGAHGADSAFEEGCDSVNGKKEIFLPWKQLNGRTSPFIEPPTAAFDMIHDIFPNSVYYSASTQRLWARNCQQVLGEHLDDPVEFIICWTPGGQLVGGTRVAIIIGEIHKIPVYNIGSLQVPVSTKTEYSEFDSIFD